MSLPQLLQFGIEATCIKKIGKICHHLFSPFLLTCSMVKERYSNSFSNIKSNRANKETNIWLYEACVKTLPQEGARIVGLVLDSLT